MRVDQLEEHKIICYQRIILGIDVKFICLYCNIEHDGEYATGRFCSAKCAKGYSSMVKREETNIKVSATLKEHYKDNPMTEDTRVKISNGLREYFGSDQNPNYVYTPQPKDRKCKLCGKAFTVKRCESTKEYCSMECVYNDPEVIRSMSDAAQKRLADGHINPFGFHGIFVYGDIELRCDSAIEYACLEYMVTQKSVANIYRCNIKIPYEIDCKCKTYNPDFEAITSTGNKLLIECKSTSVKYTEDSTNEMWRNYSRMSAAKKIVLEKYCVENNCEMFWFTQETDIKLYRKCCDIMRAQQPKPK